MHACKSEPTLSVALSPSATLGTRSTSLRNEFATRCGRYVVIEELAGEKGSVLRGYDPRLQREVRLKKLGAQSLSVPVRDRVLREARAMARVSHPNVLALYDVVEQDGEVLLAMEHVAGVTLEAWLAAQPRSLQEILSMFVAAGAGLHAAHAAGCIHRDFGAARVWVGADGRARVTDFPLGLPSELSSGRDENETSQPGAEVDQYAYCFALRECLRHPTSRTAGRIPARLRAALDRGMSADPSERWPSMEPLLEVLSSFERRRGARWASIGIVAVVLCMTGVAWAGWEARRAQRCSGGLALVGELWSAERHLTAQEAKLRSGVRHAERAWQHALAQLDDYAATWASGHRDACEATTVRGEQSVEVMDLRMACLHRAKVQLAAVADAFVHADAAVVEKSREIVASLPELQRCSDIEALQSEVAPPDDADVEAVDAARVLLAQADVAHRAGRSQDARRLLRDLSAKVEAIGYHPLQTEFSLLAGFVHRGLHDLPAAGMAFRDALVHALRSRQRSEAAAAAAHLITTLGLFDGRVARARAYVPVATGLAMRSGVEQALLRRALAGLHEGEGRFEDAMQQSRAALALYLQADASELTIYGIRSDLALLAGWLGRYEERAEQQRAIVAAYERLYGHAHPTTLRERSALGSTLQTLERYEDAVRMHRDVLRVVEEVHGPEHPLAARALTNLAWALIPLERYDEARALGLRAIEMWKNLSDPTRLALAHYTLGRACREGGYLADAETALREALKIRLEIYGPRHLMVGLARQELGQTLTASKRYDEAFEHLTVARAIAEEVHGPASPHVGLARSHLGELLGAMGRYDEAEAELEAAEQLLTDGWGADGFDTLRAKTRRAIVADARVRKRTRSKSGTDAVE